MRTVIGRPVHCHRVRRSSVASDTTLRQVEARKPLLPLVWAWLPWSVLAGVNEASVLDCDTDRGSVRCRCEDSGCADAGLLPRIARIRPLVCNGDEEHSAKGKQSRDAEERNVVRATRREDGAHHWRRRERGDGRRDVEQSEEYAKVRLAELVRNDRGEENQQPAEEEPRGRRQREVSDLCTVAWHAVAVGHGEHAQSHIDQRVHGKHAADKGRQRHDTRAPEDVADGSAAE
eukprot:Amastigsp_a685454_11.p2 type:complete len:232 gc:universal Amastigsp_a685454_11:991-296(-)